MQPTDLIVLAAIASIALWPSISKALLALLAAARRPDAAPIKQAAEGWRAGWVQNLMELQQVLESDDNNAAAIKKNRELIWLILGGDET